MNSNRVSRRVVNFGRGSRSMVGLVHEPAGSSPDSPAVLLCGPMGQEGLRAHRLLMVLADRLARVGVPSFRFDYYGTGDSGGRDTDGEIEGWVDDVLVADEQLRSFSPGSRIVWVGLRLGAVLAAMASARSAMAPDSLLLLEPIVDGAAYLRELAAADRRALLQGFSVNVGAYVALERAPIPQVPEEVLGFELSETLRRQLLELDSAYMRRIRTGRLTVAAPGESADLKPFVEAAGSAGVAAGSAALRTAIDWVTNDATGSTIAPAEIVDVVLRAAREAGG